MTTLDERWALLHKKLGENFVANRSHTAYHWNTTARECYETERDCKNCAIKRVYGMHWMGGVEQHQSCFMPIAVLGLLSKKINKTEGEPKRWTRRK